MGWVDARQLEQVQIMGLGPARKAALAGIDEVIRTFFGGLGLYRNRPFVSSAKPAHVTVNQFSSYDL